MADGRTRGRRFKRRRKRKEIWEECKSTLADGRTGGRRFKKRRKRKETKYHPHIQTDGSYIYVSSSWNETDIVLYVNSNFEISAPLAL